MSSKIIKSSNTNIDIAYYYGIGRKIIVIGGTNTHGRGKYWLPFVHLLNKDVEGIGIDNVTADILDPYSIPTSLHGTYDIVVIEMLEQETLWNELLYKSAYLLLRHGGMLETVFYRDNIPINSVMLTLFESLSSTITQTLISDEDIIPRELVKCRLFTQYSPKWIPWYPNRNDNKLYGYIGDVITYNVLLTELIKGQGFQPVKNASKYGVIEPVFSLSPYFDTISVHPHKYSIFMKPSIDFIDTTSYYVNEKFTCISDIYDNLFVL